jgi:hypothetical protein
MFPKSQDCPSLSSQATIHDTIAPHVAENLRDPECSVPSNLFLLCFPPKTVPKMAVAKNRNFHSRKNKIRSAKHLGVLRYAKVGPGQDDVHPLLNL